MAIGLMDVREAAKYLGVSVDTLYMYASTGLVPAMKLGNRWKFSKVALDEWIGKEMKGGTVETL